jgi:succinyl-diaminopimelate desuccinylase
MKDLKQYLEACLSQVDEQEILSFTQSLIRIKSFPPDFNERDVAVAAAKKFAEYGIETCIDDLGDNRANLRAWFGSEARPHIVFSGHFDTVPPVDEGWDHDPFGAEVQDGVLYGRGACDMKGGVASLIMAMCYLKKAGVPFPGRISFLGTAGEEDALTGAQAFMENHGVEDVDGIVIAEASNDDLYVAHMGALWLQFTARGIAAHPGVAWQGVNALLNMIRFFEKFRLYDFGVPDHPLLGAPTFSITRMHAGDIVNALPTLCTASVDIRTVPGVRHADILARVDAIISELKDEDPKFDLSYEVLFDMAPCDTSLEEPLCQAAFQASRDVFGREIRPQGTFFGTDASVMLKADGTRPPLIVYGPGNPANNHKVNEPVRVASLTDAVKFYMAAMLNYFK